MVEGGVADGGQGEGLGRLLIGGGLEDQVLAWLREDRAIDFDFGPELDPIVGIDSLDRGTGGETRAELYRTGMQMRCITQGFMLMLILCRWP